MSKADLMYLEIAKQILENGIEHKVEGAWYASDGGEVNVKKLDRPVIMQFNLQEEFPILTSKYVPWKKFRDEMYWIWIMQSNDVRDLHTMDIHFWDEWMGEDFTIGHAYGFLIKEYGQLDRLIKKLTTNPNDRGMIVNLWDEAHLPWMNIRPCAFLTMWDVSNGYLNCTLIQRSGDWGLGIPFNFGQYAMLVCMIAQVVGLKPGLLTHVINNAHIYDRHYDAIKEQLTRQTFDAPELWINPDIKNIYDFKPDDVQIVGYKGKHAGMLPMEIATVINPHKNR
jgi:thymidylate synthase